MSVYSWSMRHASVLLFAYAVVALAVTLVMQLDSFGGMSRDYGPGFAGSGLFRFLAAVMGSMGSAALPLFGSALLWRADNWLAARAPGVAEVAE